MSRIFPSLAAAGAGLLLLVAAGCSSTPAVPREIAGMQWMLETDSLAVPPNTVMPEQPVTLLIDDGKVSGNAGVNRYFGPVRVVPSSGTIEFGVLGVTRMAGPALAFEQHYLEMLESVESYSVTPENRLLFRSGEQVVAEYSLQDGAMQR